MNYRSVWLAAWWGLCWTIPTLGENPEPSPAELFDVFSREWRESAWLQKGRFSPLGYMRDENDNGWQVRMRVMQGLVRHGRASVPVLLERLKSGDVPQRILAAQTLGYLGPDVPADPLVAALQAEADPGVRLYLIDTLGMLGKANTVDWEAWLKHESNRDVKRHIAYVEERKHELLEPRIVEELKSWDIRQMNSAMIGQPAPDFVLRSAQGEAVRLSDFRGKRSVVLVFVYGDT